MLTIKKNRMPSEILCDIFKFLNRNDIEKCQEVSSKWNKIILKNHKNLAARVLKRLCIVYEDTFYYQVSDQWPDDMRQINLRRDLIDVILLKDVAFESVEVSQQFLYMLALYQILRHSFFSKPSKLVQSLQKLKEHLGHRIKARTIKCIMPATTAVWLLEEFFDFEEILFSRSWDYMSFIDDNHTKVLDGYKLKFTSDPLKIQYRFLLNRKSFGPNKAHITLESKYPLSKKFMRKFIKSFLNARSEEVVNFVKEMHFKDTGPSSFNRFQKLATEFNFTYRTLHRKNSSNSPSSLEIYELPRQDAWTMTIMIHTHLDEKHKESCSVFSRLWAYFKKTQETIDAYVLVHQKDEKNDTLNRIYRSF